MKKLLLVLVSAIFLGGCTPKELFIKKPSGLEIATSPTSTVYLNDENRGETPFSDKNLKPGTYTLKLVPTSGEGLTPYETKLVLTPKASTVVSRTFAKDDIDSSGYTLQLNEETTGRTYLSVISDPDNVSLNIDGKPSGFTPFSKLETTPGSHTLLVTSPGYKEQELSVNAASGYNLIVNFKLAGQAITLTPPSPSPSATASASPTPSSSPASSPLSSAKPSPSPSGQSSVDTMPKPYVLIGETGTGWLRVRAEASGSSAELGKANTGEKLKYLGESTELGWHKIEFEGSPGWVSGKYTTLTK